MAGSRFGREWIDSRRVRKQSKFRKSSFHRDLADPGHTRANEQLSTIVDHLSTYGPGLQVCSSKVPSELSK